MSIPNKYQALHEFYSSFGIPAYEENSVPKDAELPYITYEVLTSELDSNNIALSCQIYNKSNSLEQLSTYADAIENEIRWGKKLLCSTGYIMLYRGEPYAQIRPTAEKTVKAMYINISADYITL